jgi:membrane fusion protein, multidrug efflux system
MRLCRYHCLLLAIAVGWTAGCSRQQNSRPAAATRDSDAVPVTVAKVEVIPLDRTLPIVGTLFPKDEATVGAEVEGRVEKTFVEFGDRVTNGQVIAQIDTATYEALLHQAEANAARAKSRASNAEQDLRRTETLKKDRIASASDWDKAVADAEQASSEFRAAEAEAALAALHLEKSKVKVPFDAAVAERITSAGDFVRIGSPLFRIVNDNVLKYIVQAPERYSGNVRKEQPVVLRVDAYPGQTFEGKVFLISPSVNTSTRAFAFGALIDNRDHKLKASSFARGELILERNVPTAFVPLDAVINLAGITRVFVVQDDLATSRVIQLGRVQQNGQEVLAGLKAGEMVAISGQTKLRDGSKVRIKSVVSNHSTSIAHEPSLTALTDY